jgi:predicted component of type VI protein secretion system
MDMTEEENGMDELLKLQQQFTRQQEEHDDRKRQQEEQGRKAQGVLKGLKDLQFSMTIEQLKSIAKPEIIEEVNTLRNKPDTEDLRKMISRLCDDMEQELEAIAAASPEAKPTVDSMRVLNILIDLYFSL